jgi:hypothetical protein
MSLEEFREEVLREERRGTFSEEPQRAEILYVAEPFWRHATSAQRDELRRELAVMGFGDNSLIEALAAYASTVVRGVLQRRCRPPGPPPSPSPVISLEAPLRVALAAVPDGKQLPWGEIAKLMRRYWASCSPMDRARLTVRLREAGYTGPNAICNFAAHELDKVGRLKPREWNPGNPIRIFPNGIWQ